MYATAQRVESKGRSAINVFVYSHGAGRPVLQRNTDIATIAELQTGVLAHADVTIAPGGNAVLSYLDVVAPEGTALEQIERVLTDFHPSQSSEAQLVDSVGVRFYARQGVGPAAAEYGNLKARLLAALHHPKSSGAGRRPLVVIVRGDKQDLAFFLDDESTRRVTAMGGQSTGLSLRVSHETKGDFEAVFGPIYRHALPVITSLELEQILWLGGVVFRAEDSGRDLWQWPKPGVDIRHPLDMGSLYSVVQAALQPSAQATRADAIDLLQREIEHASKDSQNLPTLLKWLRELQAI